MRNLLPRNHLFVADMKRTLRPEHEDRHEAAGSMKQGGE